MRGRVYGRLCLCNACYHCVVQETHLQQRLTNRHRDFAIGAEELLELRAAGAALRPAQQRLQAGQHLDQLQGRHFAEVARRGVCGEGARRLQCPGHQSGQVLRRLRQNVRYRSCVCGGCACHRGICHRGTRHLGAWSRHRGLARQGPARDGHLRDHLEGQLQGRVPGVRVARELDLGAGFRGTCTFAPVGGDCEFDAAGEAADGAEEVRGVLGGARVAVLEGHGEEAARARVRARLHGDDGARARGDGGRGGGGPGGGEVRENDCRGEVRGGECVARGALAGVHCAASEASGSAASEASGVCVCE